MEFFQVKRQRSFNGTEWPSQPHTEASVQTHSSPGGRSRVNTARPAANLAGPGEPGVGVGGAGPPSRASCGRTAHNLPGTALAAALLLLLPHTQSGGNSSNAKLCAQHQICFHSDCLLLLADFFFKESQHKDFTSDPDALFSSTNEAPSGLKLPRPPHP